MPSKQSDQKSSVQNHSADAFEHAPFDPLHHGVMAGGTPFQPKQGGATCEFSSFRAKRAANCIQRVMKESFPFCAICLSLHRKSDMHAWRSKCGHQFCKQCSERLRQQSTVACPLCRKVRPPTQLGSVMLFPMGEFPPKKKCGSSTINSCKSTDISEVRDVVSRSSIPLSASGSVL